MESDYGMLPHDVAKGIPGGVGPKATMKEHPGVTFYVGTSDVNASLARAKSLGGKVVIPRTELPGVTMALFADPEGNRIGLVETKGA